MRRENLLTERGNEMPKMTREQKDYLWSRMRAASDAQRLPWHYDIDDEAAMPAHVKQAAATVKKWTRESVAKSERHNQAVTLRENVTKEAIYSGDYARALEAVKKYEARK